VEIDGKGKLLGGSDLGIVGVVELAEDPEVTVAGCKFGGIGVTFGTLTFGSRVTLGTFEARGLISEEGRGVAQSRKVSLSLHMPETQTIMVLSLFSGLCLPLQTRTVAGPRQEEHRIRAIPFVGLLFDEKDVGLPCEGIGRFGLLNWAMGTMPRVGW
jgi:hypothetical protein